ncbi:MAG: hypothetical protein CEO21_27 [Microgenomates group bacterium Gr01-1014_80]|nr:MAG: hypothetical protein CEO21_27 [Microgenomates group bacterium Gr01-1014_80]
MKRYQVYLNPNSIAVLDDFEELSKMSRSKLLRLVIDRAAEQAVEILRLIHPVKRGGRKRIMDSLAGFVDLKTDKKFSFSKHIDEVLLQNI